MIQSNEEDKNYWPKFVVASILIAAGSALAGEGARILGEKLRERWGLSKKEQK